MSLEAHSDPQTMLVPPLPPIPEMSVPLIPLFGLTFLLNLLEYQLFANLLKCSNSFKCGELWARPSEQTSCSRNTLDKITLCPCVPHLPSHFFPRPTGALTTSIKVSSTAITEHLAPWFFCCAALSCLPVLDEPSCGLLHNLCTVQWFLCSHHSESPLRLLLGY